MAEFTITEWIQVVNVLSPLNEPILLNTFMKPSINISSASVSVMAYRLHTANILGAYLSYNFRWLNRLLFKHPLIIS